MASRKRTWLRSLRNAVSGSALPHPSPASSGQIWVNARERESFGKPVFGHQGLAFLLADMAAAVESARATYLHAARLRNAGRPFTRQASIAKLTATDNAMRVTTDAVQVLGGAGYTRDFPVERYMRETKVDADLRGHQPDPAPRHQPRPGQGLEMGR